MNDVDRWFGRAASRRRSPVSLYTCFLTGRLLRYFRYRLRYPFLIAAVRFAVHVAEFFVVLASLGGLAAFIVMVLRAGSLLVAGVVGAARNHAGPVTDLRAVGSARSQ